MTPDRPGRWRVSYGPKYPPRDYFVDLDKDWDGRACLMVIGEDDPSRPTAHVKSPVKQFTEILETVGGAWAERVGDLPA